MKELWLSVAMYARKNYWAPAAYAAVTTGTLVRSMGLDKLLLLEQETVVPRASTQ